MKDVNNGQSHIFNVGQFGAVGDGRTKDSPAIQKAIDACAESGGGTVYCPPGTYLCGTIFLKSNVDLRIEAGATILGSPDQADYDTSQNAEHDQGLPDERVSGAHLIYARGASNIAITGRGTIDGNGRAFAGTHLQDNKLLGIPGWRPGQMITLCDCRDVLIRDVRLVDSPYWTIWPHGCERITVQGVTILNNRHMPNSDGIDPDCCRNVHISDCHIEVGDDCIAVRSDDYRLGRPGAACENITVTNCTLSVPIRGCGVRLGYAGDGPIRNCTFSNLVMFNTRTGINMLVVRDVRPQEHYITEHGPSIENISFSNIVMDTRLAVFMNIVDDAAEPGCIRNISISDVLATTERGCYIGGSRTIPIDGVRISNMKLTVRGSMDDGFAKQVPYPYPVFGRWDVKGIPHAVFCRHARNLEFHNFRVEWAGVSGSWMSAMRYEQVKDLDLQKLLLSQAPGAKCPAVSLVNVREASLRGCRALASTGTFLGLHGNQSKRISAIGNDLSLAGKAFDLGDDIPSDAFKHASNLLP